MRAALYARRSTEDHQEESIETQLDNGGRYCASRKWELVEVFQDDGKSRAEFRRRTGLVQLLNAAAAKRYDVAVTRDASRLGGDMIRTTLVIQDLLDHGRRLFYYAKDEEVRLDDATARFVVAAQNFGAELEREKISERTRETLERKARLGLVAGGVTYGYDNVRGPHGVTRVINAEEALVLLTIFSHAAAGWGARSIAHYLNETRVPPARGSKGSGSWSQSIIHEMLRRPLYIGRIEWGRWHKTYRGGTKVRIDDHGHDLVTVEIPELRIVPQDLWDAVQNRMVRHRMLTGATRKGPPARHLLSGFSRCAACGGPMHVGRAKRSYQNVPAYLCGHRESRGPMVCTNSLRRPVEIVDRAVVGWIREHALSEKVMKYVLRRVREALDGQGDPAQVERERLEADRRRLQAELDRLAAAVAVTSTPIDALLAQLQDRQQRLRDVQGRAAALAGGGRILSMGARRLEQHARARLAELHGLLADHPTEGRRALQALLRGPLRWTPMHTSEGWRYQIRGELAVGELLVTDGDVRGVVEASPAGFEPA